MTTWTLSELGCSGNCQQGRLPCTCGLKDKAELSVDLCNKCNGRIYEEEGHACEALEPVHVEFRGQDE